MSVLNENTSENVSSVTKRKIKSLEEAIAFLTKDGVNTKIRGNAALSHSLETIETHAKEQGLTPAQIDVILQVICSLKFPLSVNNKLVHYLIPSSIVWSKSTLLVFSSMCTGKLPFSFQALLVRWMIVVYEYIEDKDVIHSMYDVLFHFLESEVMCPHVCRLLYLLTRKEDVQIFRVRILLQLQQRKDCEGYLLGLLSVYKLYCPNLLTLSIPTTKKTFFKSTDQAWMKTVVKVQNKRKDDDNQEAESVIKPPAHLRKKRKKEVLPALGSLVLSHAKQTSKEKKTLHPNQKQLVPFAQISSFKQLLQNLDRVELPCQLAVALKDRNLQHVLLCYPDPAIALRMGYWLDHVLYDEFLAGVASNDKERGEELLYMLIKFSDFLQEGVPVCENFLSMYLHVWNGTDYRPYILKLITRCRLHSFQVFYDLILEPLRKLFFCSSVYFKCQIVVCLTQLLRNLVMVEWPRYKYTVTSQREQDIAVTSVDKTPHNFYSVFSEEVMEFSGLQAIQEFILFTDKMCHLGLEVETDNVLLSHCVLNFFQVVSGVFSDYRVPAFELCGRGILYKHLFTNNAMLLCRMCEILSCYRKSLNDLRTASLDDWTEEEIAARNQQIGQIPQYNSYILDFCDCLWRNKAYISTSSNTVFKLLEGLEELKRFKVHHLASSFSIYSHPALLGHVHEFQLQTQPAGVRINPHQIQNHKEVYIEFLKRQKLSGITSFIQTFIKQKTSSIS